MFMNYPASQWLNVGLYSIGMLILFTGICFSSVKLANYYIQEENKRKKLNKLKNKYHHVEKNLNMKGSNKNENINK